MSDVLPTLGPNAPGVQLNIYWADIEDIDTIPPLNLSTLKITSDITMLSSATFKLLATVREDTNITDNMQGPTDSLHFVHQANIRVATMQPEVMAALNNGAGKRCVVLVTQSDGTVNIIGNKTNYSEIMTMDTDSGKAGSTDRKGTVLNIKSIGHLHKLPVYEGEIPR